jgi:hypothetical protein
MGEGAPGSISRLMFAIIVVEQTLQTLLINIYVYNAICTVVHARL